MSEYDRIEIKTADGLTLIADVGGSESDPAVVLLHGGGQTRHSWAGAMRRLVDRGYFVMNYDARGHGESGWSPQGDYSVPALTADLRIVLACIDRPAALVGASLGGITSFCAIGCAEKPIASALVMVDIVLHPSTKGVEKITRFMTAHQNGFSDVDEAARAVSAYYPARSAALDSSGLMRNLRLKTDGRLYWHWDPRLMTTPPGNSPSVFADEMVRVSDKVRLPTLLVRGANSDVVTDEGVAAMRELVPQTLVCDVSGAGHMVAGDRNDVFADAVLHFLGDGATNDRTADTIR